MCPPISNKHPPRNQRTGCARTGVLSLAVMLWLCLACGNVAAQAAGVDSLNKHADSLLSAAPEQSLRLGLQSVQAALRTGHLSGHTQALLVVGHSYYRLNNRRKSLSYFSQALNKATVRQQDAEASEAYKGLARIYHEFGDYDHSLDLYFNALRLSEKIGDAQGTALLWMDIGTVYDAWGKSDKALTYYQRALQRWQKENHAAGLATVFNLLGRHFDRQAQYALAKQYLDRSLALHRKLKDTEGVAQSLYSIGEVYYHQHNYEQALNYYFRALNRERALKRLPAVASAYNSIAACYAAGGQHAQAIFYYEKAAVQGRRAAAREPVMKAYLGLAESKAALGQHSDAYQHHRQYAAIRDSIFNSQTNTEIAEVEAKYQLQNQQQEVELLRKERRIANLTLRENRDLTYLMGLLAAVLLVLALVMVSRFRIKQRSEQALEARNQTIRRQNDDLQQANAKLTASEADLKRLVATKDRFFTLVSHDLRGPLNSLLGQFQILIKHTDRFDRTELAHFVRDMGGTVQNVRDLLDNLLHWARTQRGGIRCEPAWLPAGEVVQEVLATVGGMAAAKNMAVKLHLPDALPVYADANMLLFVLRNLLDNAVKFTPSGGQVAVTAVQQAGGVEFAVADTGVGMEAATLEKLFRIDAYHSTAGTADEPGTGLGLVLCHEFVTCHGGRIWAESEPAKGTVVRFTLPAGKAAQD